MTDTESDETPPTQAEFLDAVETSLRAGIRLNGSVIDDLIALATRGAAVKASSEMADMANANALDASGRPFVSHFIPLTALGEPEHE